MNKAIKGDKQINCGALPIRIEVRHKPRNAKKNLGFHEKYFLKKCGLAEANGCTDSIIDS